MTQIRLIIGAAGILAIIALVIGFRIWLADVKHDAKQEGIATERATGLEKTLNQMEKASNAAETIRRDPDARRAECLRHARNSEDC